MVEVKAKVTTAIFHHSVDMLPHRRGVVRRGLYATDYDTGIRPDQNGEMR